MVGGSGGGGGGGRWWWWCWRLGEGVWPFGVFQQDYASKSDVFAVPLFMKNEKKNK